MQIVARAVATDLVQPAAFTFAPDGRIFYGERVEGWVKILDTATGESTEFFRVPDLNGEVTNSRGLLGLALHPDYPTEPYLYLYATREVDGELRTQILRVTDDAGRGRNPTVIFDPGIPVADRHNGGRILFGPDGMLYAVVGEHDVFADSQDLSSPNGKVHRMTPEGRPADGNPFKGSTVYAFGIRNSFGFDFDPETGNLWETDNGPECNDELNLIGAGSNYGWGPSASCDAAVEPPGETNQDGPEPVLPAFFFGPTLGLSGLAVCDGCGLGQRNEGAIFFGDFNLNQIHRAILDSDRLEVLEEQVVYTHDTHVLSIESGPDGALYYSDPRGIYRLEALLKV